MEVRDWIEQCLDSLQTQKDAIEAELEVIRSKQKKNQKGQSEREMELDGYRERHNYHVSRLELMLRLLDNDNLSVDEINNVKDDVNYYIESNQDPDFQVPFLPVFFFVCQLSSRTLHPLTLCACALYPIIQVRPLALSPRPDCNQDSGSNCWWST